MDNQKLCKEMLSIVFTDPECNTNKYVHAISFSKNILDKLLIDNVCEERRSLYSIEPIISLLHFKGIDSNENIKFKHFILRADDKIYSEIKQSTYGANISYIGNCKQSLLFIDESSKDYVKNSKIVLDISSNPIEIDKFYSNGIMNS
jgi:hypothetical protein